jgi:Ser/Thr protein kinase RdoA (MazF antagonist)
VHLRPAPVVARVGLFPGGLRPDGASLRRELDVARYLVAAGAPVVSPSAALPPGPHERDGLWMSFWEHAEIRVHTIPPRQAAKSLREIHELLRDFRGDLEPLAIFHETERVAALVRERGIVAPADAVLLASLATTARERAAALDNPSQPLHGDANLMNVGRTPDGLRWLDFEDTFLGPVEWDVACVTQEGGVRATESALRAYGAVDPDALEVMAEARAVQVMVWAVFMGERHPQLRDWSDRRLAGFLEERRRRPPRR